MSDPANSTPSRYGPDARVPTASLTPGVVVERRTESAPRGKRGERLEVLVPCCDRSAYLAVGQPEMLKVIMCNPCGLMYETELVEEIAGQWDDQLSFRADLRVAEFDDVAFAWRRPKPSPLARTGGR
jgi:hypothetical protein